VRGDPAVFGAPPRGQEAAATAISTRRGNTNDDGASLIDTDIVLSYAWKGVDIIPRSTLPPKALVIAFSPLLDERSIRALFDLRARGFDLAIIEVSPLPFTRPEAGEQGQIAFRLWKLEPEALRYRFQGLGVTVAVWERGQPLERVLAEVQGFRRYARRARQTRV
jgi:uncharacterized protein (DUF58 family)